MRMRYFFGSGILAKLALPFCALLLSFASAPVRSANLLDLAYDKASNELVATIAYDGTHADHRFRLEWGPCVPIQGPVPYDVGADVIDEQGMDIAVREYIVKARFGLGGFPCRPVLVTLRMGPRVNRTVLVP